MDETKGGNLADVLSIIERTPKFVPEEDTPGEAEETEGTPSEETTEQGPVSFEEFMAGFFKDVDGLIEDQKARGMDTAPCIHSTLYATAQRKAVAQRMHIVQQLSYSDNPLTGRAVWEALGVLRTLELLFPMSQTPWEH